MQQENGVVSKPLDAWLLSLEVLEGLIEGKMLVLLLRC